MFILFQPQIIMQRLESLLSQFTTAFYSDNFSELLSLQESIQSTCASDPLLTNISLNNSEFAKFKEDSYFYEQSLSHLSNSDWELVSNHQDIIVESHYSGADFYTRASVLINATIFETLSVINEEDLLPSWYFLYRIHPLSQVTVLSSPAKFKKLMRYSFWFPWPLANRECYLEFSAYPVPESQGMLIIMRSPKSEFLHVQLPSVTLDVERMSVPLGCLLVQYINPVLTKVSILVQANATEIRQSMLPEWLVNFGKKQMMYFLMDSLRISVMNFPGSEYENRVTNNPGFYSFLRKVLENDVAIN